MVELTQQPIKGGGFAGLEVQWVDTHRAVYVGITVRQGLDVGGVVGTDADTQEVPYPTLASGLQRCIQGAVVLGEVETIKVAMGVYEHRKLRLEITESCLADDTPVGHGN
jgi:hypothetical protein